VFDDGYNSSTAKDNPFCLVGNRVRLARRGSFSLPPSRLWRTPRHASRVLQGVNGPSLIGSTSQPRTHGTPRTQASMLRNTLQSNTHLSPLSIMPSLTQVVSPSCSRARASDWLRLRQLLPMTLAGHMEPPTPPSTTKSSIACAAHHSGSCTCLCANRKARGGGAQGWRVAWYAIGAFSALAFATASGRAAVPVAHRVRV
jgi:hypothetical protein